MTNGISDKMAGQLTEVVSGGRTSAATVFWIGGLLAFIYSQGWNLKSLLDFASTIDIAQLLAIAAGAILIIKASSGIMLWLQLPISRIAEGYWPSSLNFLKNYLIKSLTNNLDKKEEKWISIAKRYNILDNAELEEYLKLDAELDNYPSDRRLLLPTELGNILRSAEDYPNKMYGLNAFIIWPRLWLVLPENAQRELSLSKEILNERILLIAWSLAFTIWSVFTPWVLLVAIIGAFVAYRGSIEAAYVYCLLQKASYDIYRHNVYRSLNIPIPAGIKNEYRDGVMLTEFLKRGLLQ